MLGSQKEERVNAMRKFQKMLAASVLVLLPRAYASAQQQDYQGGGRQNRQFNGGGQYNGQNNGGDQQYGQDRQSRRQRNNFGDNGGYGGQYGGNNGGFGNGGNGGGFNNGGGFGRQPRGFDNSNSSSNSSPTVVKTDSNKSSGFVPPVATGPFTFSVQQLPKEYALLNSRSIFSKDHRSIQPEGPKPPVFPNAPVAALVYRGAMRLDTGAKPYAAQIEDINSSKAPTWVSEGDLLTASGARVTEITLDHIVVEKNGVRRLITIGVNLDQGEKLPTPSSGTASASPTASAGAGESQVKMAASAGSTSEEDVAETMRRRRQAQLGQ
jgi:hypothetical protein